MTNPIKPLYEPLPTSELDDLIRLFADKKDLMVLASTKPMDSYGRYSYLCFDSFWSFSSKDEHHQDSFGVINNKINKYKTLRIEGLPPLQGGLVGYFGYEAGHYLENLPYVKDNIKLPDIYLNAYSHVIAIDHISHACWVIATGFPETSERKRLKKAQEDIDKIKALVFEQYNTASNPQNHLALACSVSSNFTRESYVNAVNSTKEYILNGDIFQANMTQQFSAVLPDNTNPMDLYFNLMETNPAPFSAFIKIPEQGYIISASPERFIKLTDKLVETCPIKGTRKRSNDSLEDMRLANELLTSDKDRAENVMIVDLMRNDMSRVCQSVEVKDLCALKSFETVHHLVSTITGILKNNMNAIDLIKATFPPGSVTGAPKIRAMEIISELEQQTRGPYCGCLGYFSFTGDMDTSVIIRTYFIQEKTIFFSAGGAVVLDSDADEEYEESLTKADALIKVLTQ